MAILNGVGIVSNIILAVFGKTLVLYFITQMLFFRGTPSEGSRFKILQTPHQKQIIGGVGDRSRELRVLTDLVLICFTSFLCYTYMYICLFCFHNGQRRSLGCLPMNYDSTAHAQAIEFLVSYGCIAWTMPQTTHKMALTPAIHEW